MINNILRENYEKPLKIQKVFYLNEESKRKRIEFCQKILDTELDGKILNGINIFFTYELK